MRITNRDGEDHVPANRRELVGSASPNVLADYLNDANTSGDLSEEDLTKGLGAFSAVGVQLTSDVGFYRQIFRV